jgi:glycine/D-amino acid oxidase-like deaminating enzyme
MTSQLNVGVLIVGGGAMGLWHAHDLLAAGRSFAILEQNTLGGVQTCHSHVYIHQGFIYREVDLAARLRSVTATWQDWLGNRQHLVRSRVSFFGFRPGEEFKNKLALWEDPLLRLQCAAVTASDWPAALAPGAKRSSGVETLVTTPEQSLDGHLLVKELAGEFPDSLFRIDSMDRIDLAPGGVDVVARHSRHGELRIRSRFLVLAAGAGNLPLLITFFSDQLVGKPSPQQIRKAHMMVIRGPKDHLPPLYGVFGSFGGLFMVSRELSGENVWLVSDYRSPAEGQSRSAAEQEPWQSAVLEYLYDLAPAVMERADRLRWGVYEAPKAEGATDDKKLPDEERILDVGDRVWAVWPTKLTLAPQASAALLSRMDFTTSIAPVLDAPISVPWERPGVAPERWSLTPLRSWEEFRGGPA